MIAALLLAACDGPVADSGAAPDVPPCQADADPARSMDFPSLLARLDTQGCLADEDVTAAELEIARFHAEERVWCDQVYRLSSPDGLWFDGLPELIRPHASVPDILMAPDGTQVLMFVDLGPDLFMATLRTDPARFWRQGLLGLGGVGMMVDHGAGFEDTLFDAHLAALEEMVDPDIGLAADGSYRLAWYGVPVASLAPDSWDPYMAEKPHLFRRTISGDLGSFPVAPVVVASSEGEFGEADPTVLTLPNGAEVLYAGAWEGTAKGWSTLDGEAWATDEPDIDSMLPAAGPDVVPDGEGGYRLYFVDTLSGGEGVATSQDGLTWTYGSRVMEIPEASGGSVARAPDGTWWIYFNMPDPECVRSLEG